MTHTKTILCFGDSNTWGSTPDDTGRFDWSVRWPGVLQQLLGDQARVVEDGHGGRTTVFEDPLSAGKRGADDLPKAIDRAEPVDILILMLGTNDVKVRINAAASAIAEGMGKLVEIAKESKVVKEIVIVSPPAIVLTKSGIRDLQFDGAIEKLVKVAEHYERIARVHGVRYVNLTVSLSASPIDGIHLSKETHREIAVQLAKIIQGT
jgi:lysophospholipase L1-like esterase